MKFSGTVIKGDGYGKKLGYPTANLDRDDYQKRNLALTHGVYGGIVTLGSSGEQYGAGIVIGPDDPTGLPKLEAHLIDFAGDLYGEMVTFHVKEYIRPFKEYESEEALKEAITQDIETIKNLYK
jgi:riboflavin kinase/FMN adenylyltransferase